MDIPARLFALLILLTVIMTVVITLGLFLLGLGPGGTDVEDAWATLIMGAPSVDGREVGGVPHWDASTRVADVTPSGAEVPWTELRVMVVSSTGDLLLGAVAALPDNPPAYDDASDGTVDVEVWYVDVYDDGHIDMGDDIKLTGLTAGCEGATVRFTRDGEIIAAIVLPSTFG